jgi:hypothetical protein
MTIILNIHIIKKVLKVDCKKSKIPVYLGKDEEFYIRSNPATDELTGKRLVEYIKIHFNEGNNDN